MERPEVGMDIASVYAATYIGAGFEGVDEREPIDP
jgi:hypothetical protein